MYNMKFANKIFLKEERRKDSTEQTSFRKKET